jgi:hypothetical protein
MRATIGQSTETECQPLQKPWDTRDDPFGVNDLKSEASLTIANAGAQLKGIPSD